MLKNMNADSAILAKLLILFFSFLIVFTAFNAIGDNQPIAIKPHEFNKLQIIQEKLTLNENQAHYSFSNKLSYFIDKSSNLSLQAVQKELSDKSFALIQKDNISLGYIKSVVWLHFLVENKTSQVDDWLLIFDYPLIDEIEIFFKREDQMFWQSQLMGDSLKFHQRPVDFRAFASPIKLKNGSVTEVFVKIRTSSSMQIRPSLASTQIFFEDELSKEMFYGVVYGIMILMALYNLFLYLAVRDKSYLAYVFSVVSGCIFIMALNGHAYQYLWPDTPWLANTAIPLFTSLWMTSTALFTQMFLETKKFAPKLYKAINFLIAFATFSVFYSLFGDYQSVIKIATGLALLNGILILSTSVVCWRAGNRFARFFVGAWAVYGVGTALLVISRFGLLADYFITHNSASIGLLVEIIMLSLALSDKYRVLNEELELHTLELEDKVALRTQELEKSNAQLHKLSRYDALTNLPNRRYFDTQLEQEWGRSLRESESLSILVCDVDEFKNINDHFGHQYGDDCLKAVADAIIEALNRPADMPARFGGDEFVVILPETKALGAELLGIKICENINALALSQAPDALHKIVTLSIGCATLKPDSTNNIQQLFALADKNLFKAKKNGRNCVVSDS